MPNPTVWRKHAMNPATHSETWPRPLLPPRLSYFGQRFRPRRRPLNVIEQIVEHLVFGEQGLGDFHGEYASRPAQVQTRFRSPYTLSMRPTAGQNLCS